MSESSQRRRVVDALRKLGAFAVENRVGPGTPDVAYAFGWIELKQVHDWPSKEDTPLRVEHFTKEQRLFLRDFWNRGGLCHLLLRVEATNEWLLFTGPAAAEYLGTSTRSQLRGLSCWAGTGRMMEAMLPGEMLRAWHGRYFQ